MLRRLFVGAYEEFAPRCRAFDDPGVAVVAVCQQTGKLAGVTCIPALAGVASGAVIGRHERADVFLSTSATLALRHVAVIVEPVVRWQAGFIDVRYRVLDLRSENGFRDETGRTLRALACEGPAIISCSGYALYFLVTGDPTDFPQLAQDAWEFLPERVYFDEVHQFPEGSRAARLGGRRFRSRITRSLPPLAIDDPMLCSDSGVAGTLVVSGPGGDMRLDVGESSLSRGILVGRYPRCNAGTTVVDASVSRVHLLLVSVGDHIYALDTGSSNGTYTKGRPISRIARLEDCTALILGRGETRVTWISRTGSGPRW